MKKEKKSSEGVSPKAALDIVNAHVKKELLSEKEIMEKLKEIAKLNMPLEINKKLRKLKNECDYPLQALQKQLNHIRKGMGGGSGAVVIDDIVVADVADVTNDEIKATATLATAHHPLPPTLFGDSNLEQIIKNLVLSKRALTFGELAIKIGKSESNIRNTISRNKGSFGTIRSNGKMCYTYVLQMVLSELEARIHTIKKREKEKEQEKIVEEQTLSKSEDLILESKKFFEYIKKDIGNQLKQNKGELIINFNSLSEFSPILSEDLISDPEHIIDILETSLEEIGIVKNFRVRIINLPIDRKVFIENIRAKYVNELISIEGRVVSISDVRPQVVNAKFECPSCGTIISVLQIEKKFREPSRCSCGRRGGFKLISKEMVDTARIILEDLQEKTDNPHTRRLDFFIKESLTNPNNIKFFTPGNEVKLVGILKEIPIPLPGGGLSTRFQVAVEVNSVELCEEEVDITKFSDNDIKEIEDVCAKIDIEGLQEINTSFAPDIYGCEEIKNAIILQLCNKKNSSIKGSIRNKPNILLIGDPGSAKSVLGNFAVEITPGARKVTGGGSSAVGITASVIREDDGWRVEPGAFVLAKDLLFIDELNNLHDEDKPKLQEAMSEQSVTIAKANIRMKMKVTAGALATANPVKGTFNHEEDFVKQFNLPAPIINRFDEIFIIIDKVNEDIDKAIAKNMLNRERGKIKAKYDKEFLKKFFVYVKQTDEPTINDEISKYMQSLYSRIRQYKTESININPRFKETIIRLSKASAKIRLSDKVEKKDIERSINILHKSYYNIPDYSAFK